MAVIKLIAICTLFYAILKSEWWLILFAIAAWEVGGGFKGSIVLFLDDLTKR